MDLFTVFPVFHISRLDLMHIYGFTQEQVELLTDEDMQAIATSICYDMQHTIKVVRQKVYRETTKLLQEKGSSDESPSQNE